MRFNKGNTYPTGISEMCVATIDDATGDDGRPWGSRIECHGKTAEEAEALRDLVLASLAEPADTTQLEAELHKVVKRFLNKRQQGYVMGALRKTLAEANHAYIDKQPIGEVVTVTRDVLTAVAKDVFAACEKEEGTIYGVDLGAIVDRYVSNALPTDVLETERLTFDRASRDPGAVAVVYQDGRHVPVQLTLGTEGVECGGYASKAKPEDESVTATSDLRDKFAGLAMQGMVSSPNCPVHANDHEIARQAYALADAMLAKR